MCKIICERSKYFCKAAGRSIRFALWRELPTKVHKKAWLEVETILCYRANIWMVFSLVLSAYKEILRLLGGTSMIDRFEDYKSKGKPYNEELVLAFIDFLEVFEKASIVILLLMLLISTKSFRICQFYPIFYAIKLTTYFLVPQDYGDHESSMTFLMITIGFAFTAFDFWKPMFAYLIPICTRQAMKFANHEVESSIEGIVIRCIILSCFYAIAFLLVITFIYGLGNMIV